MTTVYYKITNKDENHHGFQYTTGLNLLVGEFNDNIDDSCCAGGLYFTSIEHVFKYLDYGVYLRKITLPTSDPNFKMVKDKTGDKWRANMVILGKCRELSNPETFKYLIKKGADIHSHNEKVLIWSAKNNYLDILKLVFADGKNLMAVECTKKTSKHIPLFFKPHKIITVQNLALALSSSKGYLDIMSCLIKQGADIHFNNDCILKRSCSKGRLNMVKYLFEITNFSQTTKNRSLNKAIYDNHISIVKFLVENGAYINSSQESFLFEVGRKGHTDIFKFLFEEQKYDINNNNLSLLMITCAKKGHFDMVKYLVEKGVDIHTHKDAAISYSSMHKHTQIVDYLIDKGADINKLNKVLRGHNDILGGRQDVLVRASFEKNK